mgnify:CR=1 FL=1
MTRMRLNDYDYRNDGYYFITIVTRNRMPCLSKIKSGKVELLQAGLIVRDELINTDNLRRDVFIDEYIIMPDHIHFILILSAMDSIPHHANKKILQNYYSAISPESGSVSTIVRIFKAAVTRKCRTDGLTGFSWQRGFYDRIIRDQNELNAFRNYIVLNPERVVMK